ncbi:MAG: hypothetical protein V1646_01240 [bacterium]
MKKIRLFFLWALMFNNLVFSKILNTPCLDRTTKAPIYKNTKYVSSNKDLEKSFVRTDRGFSVPAGTTISIGSQEPVSGNIKNKPKKIIPTENLNLDSNAKIQNGGKVGTRFPIVPTYLYEDLIIPAGSGIVVSVDAIIDGLGHEIIFEDANAGGYIWIDGPAGTTLTIRNCIIKGLKNYPSGYGSIGFGDNEDQKLVLNQVYLHLAGNYNFSGGMLDIKNTVNLTGTTYFFAYNSEYELTIKSDSTFFIDTRTYFTYDPAIKKKTPTKGMFAKLIVMEDKSSRLFLNGCTLYLPLKEGLILTNGHLIVDHKTIVYGNGFICGDYAYGMAFGNGKEANDLLVDIMPGANFEVQETTLHYNNAN